MKTHLFHLPQKFAPGFALVALLATTTLHAQTSAPAPAPSADQSSGAKLSPDDLNDLLGPIALYPDALVALILPASTVPSDITMAARFLNDNGDNANVDDQPSDPSVKALARYPDVLKWMDQNLEWTNSLGEAFVEQPADVMNAVQTLRGEAKAKGNLVDTPQQTVVVEKQSHDIRIVPTQPDVIYVPQYDPEVVYAQPYQPDLGPVLAFGAGFAVGAWLNYDCDWGNHGVYYGNNYGWNNQARWNDRGYRDGNVNIANTTINNTNINNTTVNRWQASANSRRQFETRQRHNVGNARIAHANAAVRHPNGQNVNGHHVATARVPKPARLNVANNHNGGKHPNAEVRNPGAANAGKGPNKAPNANGKHPNAANNPGNPNHHPKPNTSAPPVNGQSGSSGNGNKHPNTNPNHPHGGNSDQPKHKPSTPPPGQGGGSVDQPKKHHNNNNADRPKEPSAAPQSKPHAQEHSPSAQPKHHQQQQPKSEPKPQAHKQEPQVHKQAPQAHSGGSGQQQGNGNNKKKKKDNNGNN